MVIVGAGEAGTAAAVALRERGWRSLIVLIGNEKCLPYERPPLSKATLTEETNPGPKMLVTHERLAELGILYLEGTSVESIDRAAHAVILSGGTRLGYERLLLATGARPRIMNKTVEPKSRITTLRTYADAVAIRSTLGPQCKVLVIGGGFIGLEVAASAVTKGASVTVLEAGPRLLMRAVPALMADLIRAKHERSGVRIVTGANVKCIDVNESCSAVFLEDGRKHFANIVLVGIGAVPNVELAQAAGLATDNGIMLDETLATSDPDIFAAGDCCSFPHRLYGERIRLEAWRNAREQGAAAAANMLGAERPYIKVPWFWSDQYDETLQIAGLFREQDALIPRVLGPRGNSYSAWPPTDAWWPPLALAASVRSRRKYASLRA